MLCEKVVQYCSPTLAGLKTGSLFVCSYAGTADRIEFRSINRDLSKKGLRFIPLRIRDGRVLSYLYRPEDLKRDLEQPACRALLDDLGYEGLSPEQCLIALREKLQDAEESFPHEIGLFLGYPPEDVRGFIEEEAGACKCTGCWKVYGDEQAARALFAKYDACTACYLRQLACGTTLAQLAVAV